MRDERFDQVELGTGRFAYADGPGPGTPVVTVRVNGSDLRAVLMDARAPRLTAEHATGKDGSASLEELLDPEDWDAFLPLTLIRLPSRHWLGEPHPRYSFEGGEVAVLTCSCGDFGCGGVTAEIEFTAHAVNWRNFREANGDPIPTTGYRFIRQHYEDAIDRLGR